MGAAGRKKKARRVTWSKLFRLPEPLENEAQTAIEEHPELGYTGIPELIRDAVREKIADIKTKPAIQEVPAQ